MKIKVLKLGRSTTEVEVPAGSVVEEALEKAEVDYDGYSLTINGAGTSLGSVLNDNDIVTMVPKIEGGR